MAELTFNSLWSPTPPPVATPRRVIRSIPRPVRPTGTELFEKLEVDEVAQEERNRPSCRKLVPCISPTCLCTMLAVLAIPIALAPGQTHAYTVSFVLHEIHFDDYHTNESHHDRRRASELAQGKALIEEALTSQMHITPWQFFVHHRDYGATTDWTITLVIGEYEYQNFWGSEDQWELLVPHINDAWQPQHHSIFELSKRTLLGTVVVAQLLSRGQFTLKETYFAGSHVVQDPDAAQETGEISAILRTVLAGHGMAVHDLKMVSINLEGTTNQLAVTWSVVITALTSSDWAGLGEYVESFGFTTALTSAATTAGSTQHMNSFFEAVGDLTTESIGLGNVPSPPPAASAP